MRSVLLCASLATVTGSSVRKGGDSIQLSFRSPQLHGSVSRPLLAASRGEPASRGITAALWLRGGGSGAQWLDATISVIVLLAVSAAAHSGSSFLAAVFSTAPTGVPLSLWLVHRAACATEDGHSMAIQGFLLACIKGAVALACFCVGALALLRVLHYDQVTPPSWLLPSLLTAGYASWVGAWVLLRRTT